MVSSLIAADQSSATPCLIGGGELGALMRAHDWSTSPLGLPENWPQALCSVVGLMINSRFPMFVAWGDELGFLYNDAYAEILGSKHPQALGARFRDIWGEIWDDISPLIDAAMAGEASYRENLPLVMRRNGFDEQTWFTFSYSPVRDEDGAVAGMFCACTETTRAVVGEQSARENEARVRGMADSAPVMLWVTDADGQCVYLNARWYAFTGQAPGAGEGMGWLDAVHPEDRDAAEQAFRSANAERRDYRVDFRLRRADGSYAWTIDAAAARFARDGRFVGHVGSVIDIDDRKAVEQALAESEARLRMALEGARLGTWSWDVAAGLGTWSARTMEILGASKGENITVEERTKTIHPDDRARVWAEFAAAVESGDELNSEYRAVRPNGEIRWIASRGALVRDAAGLPVRASGIVLDVTERAAAEAALRELNATLEQRVADALAEKRLFAEMVENTDASAQILDMEFRFLAVNDTARRDYERSFGVVPRIGQSLDEVLAHLPDERDAALAAWSRVMAGEAYVETRWWGDESLERRAFEMRFRPLLDDDGRQIGAFLFGLDVTDRLREQERLAAAEAARREADALYRAYFENSAEALFVVNVLDDGGFTIEDLNPAHQESIGLPLAEVAGKRIDEVLPPELAAPVIAHYRHVLASGRVYQYRETFQLHGEATYWDTVLVPVRDGEGRIVRLIGSSRDLTRQLAAEEQLRQSQKMEAMGQLTGGVAHDFNNLLTPIIGSLDMLLRRGLGNEREQRLIGGAMQSAERAKILVQRLLAFARRQPLQASAVDLGQLVTGMAGLIESTLGPKVDVRVDVADDLPPARADANQLEMALLNLAVNARDAMPDGGVLTISAAGENVGDGSRSTLKPGPYLRLGVTDTGTGMDAETLQRAIEPFFSTKGIGKGTGLGLSMVHGLAGQLGGGLRLTSEPGRGTTVELWLPATATPVGDAPDQLDLTPTISSRGRALLVDDEDLVRMSTADMLADLGYEVFEAGSAEEALQLLRDGIEADVLVTDHLMPGMSGTELVAAARRLKPELPALIVSGYADVDGIAPDLPRLTKPFRNAELAERLVDLVGR